MDDPRAPPRNLFELLLIERGEAMSRLKAVATDPLLPLASATEAKRLAALCADLAEEGSLAREGYRLAMRATGVTAGHLIRQRVLTEAKR